MATREKTVIYAFPMTTGNITDATLTNLTQITVYIPESSPTFTSVYAEISWRDIITATGGTITEHRCALQLGTSGYTTVTETDDITHSGESMGGVIGPFNFTTVFSNWSGTSMTCDLQVYFDQTTGTTLGMTNVSALLYITYTYDDSTITNATQIKTVRIPFDSPTGVLPTVTNSTFDQIPQLTGGGGILPEASVTIRDYFILIEGNESGSATTTNYLLTANIGSAPETFGVQTMNLASDVFNRWVYKPSVPDTTSAHTFELWSSMASRCSAICAELIITYEFDASSTTSILNSILIPLEIASPLGNPDSTKASLFTRNIFTVEPGTLSLKNSSFRLNFNTTASPGTMYMSAGSQGYRAYTPIANVACGQYCYQQRIDSGAVQGSGFTLTRGKNVVTIRCYATNSTNQITNIMGYILLNYTSDVGDEGIGQANHTVYKTLLAWDALLTDELIISNYSFSIPEANYWLVGTGFEFIQWVATTSQAITFDVQCLPTEGKQGGYYDIYADAYQGDAERACTQIWMRGRDVFKRFPQENVEDRLDIESSRNYRLFTTTTCSNGIIAICTYHSFTWTVGGNITGSNEVDNITLNLIRVDDNFLIQTQTIGAEETTYSFTVYNNTELYYVVAYQDSTRLGNTAIGFPT